MRNFEIYSCDNIDSFVPKTDDDKFAYDYFYPMIKKGVKKYIGNVDTTIMLIKYKDITLPININNDEYSNSYVSSFYCHYISYANEELKELKQPMLEWALKVFIKLLGFVLKLTKCDKIVYVNNWLLSTNLYGDIDCDTINEITKFLKSKFPKHAIVFRSINDTTSINLMNHLKYLRYCLIGSRQVYLFDKNRRCTLKGNPKYKLNQDIKLLSDGSFAGEKIDSVDAAYEIVNLYNVLYIDKYSKLNPTFSSGFIENVIKNKLLSFYGFYEKDNLVAVLGYIKRQDVITTPIYGYDTKRPKDYALYRRMSAQLVLEAEERNVMINMSSGASKFKIYRGAKPSFEYTAVYCNHLSLWRRFGYKLVEKIVNYVAIYFMKKNKL